MYTRSDEVYATKYCDDLICLMDNLHVKYHLVAPSPKVNDDIYKELLFL